MKNKQKEWHPATKPFKRKIDVKTVVKHLSHFLKTKGGTVTNSVM
jgi:hypothetical protein